MGQEFGQAINNEDVEAAIARVMSSHEINGSLFESTIAGMLDESYPEVTRDTVERILQYYSLWIAAEQLVQPSEDKDYVDPTPKIYESFNPKLRHLHAAGNYTSVFDLNISNLNRLSKLSGEEVTGMLLEISRKKPSITTREESEKQAIIIKLNKYFRPQYPVAAWGGPLTIENLRIRFRILVEAFEQD